MNRKTLSAREGRRGPQRRPPRLSGRTRMLAALAAAIVVVLSVLVTAALPASAGMRASKAAQSAFQAAIQQIVNDGVPGAIGFARNGSQVTVAASGLADIAARTPMTPGDRVRVGSLTKTFVATDREAGQHTLALPASR